MSDENQETIADIVAEIRGAKTEFPFVYLMGEPDTQEVIDAKTKEIIEPRKINIRRVTVNELADRIEAAAKREKSETEADALNVGAIVATTEKSSAVGNASAMREALLKLDKLLYIGADGRVYGLHDKAGEIERTIKAALALPPRNCDVFRSEAEAKSAFIAYYNEAFDLKGSKYAIDTCDLKHDVDGILHDYIEWLFATAKSEAKVESNGSK